MTTNKQPHIAAKQFSERKSRRPALLRRGVPTERRTLRPQGMAALADAASKTTWLWLLAALLAQLAVLSPQLASAVTLGQALDATNLIWTTSAGVFEPWVGQTTNTHDGIDAAQSGPIGNQAESWVQTTVPGPGTLTFWWSVSSEPGYDYLELRTNDVTTTRISGEVGWTFASQRIASGPQRVRWSYTKDWGDRAGRDRGWVDQVSYTPDDALLVQPADGLIASGNQGGPFSPPNQVYTLSNGSGSALTWTAAADQTWVTVSPPGGSLGAGASGSIEVQINGDAGLLPPGIHRATVTFSNATSGLTQSRSVELTVISTVPGTRYVNLNNAGPVSPYTSWATAATNIQDAVDAAVAGDLILVTNGIYQTGGKSYGMSNRVAVTKPVTVRSVNGPTETLIVGYQVPDKINGDNAVRCVYLASGAVLAGFTLTNGATQTSGLWYQTQSGGGVWCESASAVVSNCVLTGNSAQHGGGAYEGTFYNCALIGNSTRYYGGGTRYGTFNNCTLLGNTAFERGGGAAWAELNNCIVYYNTARSGSNNCYGGTQNYCCTTPLPSDGSGNFTSEPQLAGNWHLSTNSPCRGAGSATNAIGLDLDGEAWANPPSVGCDEFWSGSVTGSVSVAIQAAYTNVAVGFETDLRGLIGGRVSASRWNFGDGVVVSNRPWATHAWNAPGQYVVELRAYNESNTGGVTASVAVQVVAQPVHYVALNNATPAPPYTSWATAATNIQKAVDAAVPGALVLVSNGVYQSGAVVAAGMSNRLALTKSVTVQSVNGPAVTTIAGYQVPGTTNGPTAVRCVYLADGVVLAGFTLTRGATQNLGSSGDDEISDSGGGAWCESASGVLSNCVLTGNSANHAGGGAKDGTLKNCVLTGNTAYWGGGAYYSTLYHCTLTGNSATTVNGIGGGTFWGTLNNCIVYYNTAPDGPNYFFSTFNYSCTTGLPDGPGNIADVPRFVTTNGWSNLRLQSNSPCINAGNNSYTAAVTDLDGRPRIVGGTVDMGAYEYQGPGMSEFIAWLRSYGLPTDGAADTTDPDADGLNTWQEWRCQTDPTNALSVLRLLSAARTGTDVTVTWQSVAGVSYFLERSTDLSATRPFTSLATNLPGQSGATSFTDTNASAASRLFYRVGVP